MSTSRQHFGNHHSRPAGNAREIYYNMERNAYPTDSDDIFAINPLRRSFYISLGSWLLLIIPALFLRGNAQALVLIGAGWMAAAGVVFVTPIFFWCLAEVAWGALRTRTRPTIDQLDISQRAFNLLMRYGYESIASVDRADDSSLLLLSNMDARTVHEIRRAVNIWKYQRWQERGFPAGETPESTL